MRVRVQLFARLAELADRRDWSCDLPSDATVADVWQALAAAHPAVAPLRSAVSAAVNADFAPMSRKVEDGDDVAFLPPVSGGSPSLLHS